MQWHNGAMRKIPTIYLRDTRVSCSPVTGEINPECQWVFDGHGTPTRKIDGINVKIQDGIAYQRIKPLSRLYDKAKYDAITNESVMLAVDSHPWPNGIYEAYGEGIKDNMEGISGQSMVSILPLDPVLILYGIQTNYRSLMAYFSTHDIEGIVFHHKAAPETMAKIKTRDFFHLHRPRHNPIS